MAFRNAVRAVLNGVTVGNRDIDDSTIRGAKFNKRHMRLDFLQEAVSSKRLGGATTGATGDRNQFLFPDGVLEGHVKGTQTILTPVLTALGWDLGMDQTQSDGYELTPGILGRLDGIAYKIGTDAAFYTTLKAKLADSSGCGPFWIGFRTAVAYQAVETNYQNYAFLGVAGGANPAAIKIQSQLGGGGTVLTDTTNTFADAATKTFGVWVSAGGVVTYTVDGLAPTTVAAYTFTAGVTVIPCVYYLHGADICDTIELIRWECGFQVDG